VEREAVAQAGLDDALAPLDLVHETMEIGQQVEVDGAEVGGHDGAEQDAAESGRRVDGEHQMAERDAPRRGEGARMPHLELGQQHER